jgi:predicted DNA binding protein
MVISTTVYAEHPDLALVPTIRAVRDIDIGVVSEVGTDPDNDAHFFWVEASDFDAVETAFEADHTVESFTSIAGSDSRRTYRIQYSDGAKLISPSVVETGGLVLESRSHANGWILELQLESHETLEELSDFADRQSIQFDVRELRQEDDTETDREFGLTERQAEALVNAHLHGYYDDPRETSLEEIATFLDISQTAVSGRLRRGSARLIEEVLVEETDDGA